MSGNHKMTMNRYNDLFMSGKEITNEELSRGWHYCPDWDMMIVRKGYHEGELCLCDTTSRRDSKEEE